MKTIKGKLTGTPKINTDEGKESLNLTATGPKGSKTNIELDVTEKQKAKLVERLGGKGPKTVDPEITDTASILGMINGLAKERGLTPSVQKTIKAITGSDSKTDQKNVLKAIGGVIKALKKQGMDIKI